MCVARLTGRSPAVFGLRLAGRDRPGEVRLESRRIPGGIGSDSSEEAFIYTDGSRVASSGRAVPAPVQKPLRGLLALFKLWDDVQ